MGNYKLMENIKRELESIAEKGLSSSNLDTAYKLVDMLKDMENCEYWGVKREYYETVLEEMRGGYSSANDYSMARIGRYANDDGYSRGSYSRAGDDMGGQSYRRGQHYVRGHYSRAGESYDKYMDQKQSYRSGGKDEDCKRRMLAALEEHMQALTSELGDMSKDADCREERETINRYIDKIRGVMM